MTGTGTLLNGLAIVAGGVLGLTLARHIPEPRQLLLKRLIGVFTIYVGLSMAWQGLNGSFLQVLKQFGIMMLSLSLGNFTGHTLGLQRALNRLGLSAKERFARAQSGGGPNVSEGFMTCTLLFCVGPMAIIGALKDGFQGDYRVLAVKAAMDGLSTMAFAATFGWGVILSAIPVVAYQGTITLLAGGVAPWLLQQHDMLDSLSAAGGMIVCSIALVIFELKRVELANYLPALIYAPFFTWLWR